MQQYHKHFSTTRTPQTQPIPDAGTPQVQMDSGGYGWAVDDWTRLDRFLVLGTEGGTYYASAPELTRKSAQAVMRCIREDGRRTVHRIVEISKSGRAAKNDPALFALAMCCKLGDPETAAAGYRALPEVARIGTHLFHWVEYCKAFGGLGGNGFKRALSRWYSKPADRLALQLVKYQQRDGWSHRDLLRLAHTSPATDDHNILYSWAVKGWGAEPDDPPPSEDQIRGDDDPLRLMIGFELAKRAESAGEVASLIQRYNLPRECVPTQFLNATAVWEAMLPGMPMTAMIRNLGKMTSLGMVTNTSEPTRLIVERLGDPKRIRGARLHPMTILLALKTYANGRGFKGKLSWSPAARVVDALDAAFYTSFGVVVPTGKRLCLGLDVSGSMTTAVSGQPLLSCREAAATMALVTAVTERVYEMVAFTSGGAGHVPLASHGWGGHRSGVAPINISPRQRLDDVLRTMRGYPFGRTDCALPILWAMANKVEVDAFVTYTDNESWAGEVHVDQALRQYRNKTGIPAKLVAVAFSANNYSVANPDDAGQLDVVGLDTATPNVISDFIRQ
jgi:60 kDa SS-A/Ro ribonucleoprotein